MKCPMGIAWQFHMGQNPKFGFSDCLEEECAWWEKEAEGCAMALIGIRLGTVCDQITEVIDKMPHEEQFRR